MNSTNWKVDPVTGHVLSIGSKTIKGLPAPTATGEAANYEFALESRGLTLSYSANKTLIAADFAGRDLSKANVVIVCTANMTLTLPNDASRVLGAKLTLIRTYSGNLQVGGNGALVQDLSNGYAATPWFVGTVAGSVTYIWNGSSWSHVGLPTGYSGGHISPENIAAPNSILFASTDAKYSQYVTPANRSAYNAALANAGTLTCDHAMPTNSRLTRILFLVRVGDFAFDCTALAKRVSGTTTLITATPKPIFTAADYSSPPAISLALTVSGTNVRLTLTNSSGSAQIVAMGSVALEEDIS